MTKPPIVWTIAGFDPSCGAGIAADLKTISALACYGAACITALTVQNTLGVRRVEPVSAQTVRETLEALLEDLPPSAIKIGMLATEEIACVVADFLQDFRQRHPELRCPIVLDPILRSSSGAALLDEAGTGVLLARLLPLCTVVTPNRAEAARLTGVPAEEAEAAARALRGMGAASAVVTGGDPLASALEPAGPSLSGAANTQGSEDGFSEDVLAYAGNGLEFVEILTSPRIRSRATHGTGCVFSTAIACGLARGRTIPAAVTSAKAFVSTAIERAPGLGHGRGPMGLDRCAEK